MNRIYRLVWSRHAQSMVAVAENTRSTGKAASVSGATIDLRNGARPLLRRLSLLLALAYAPVVLALPQGGQVAAGSGSISSSSNAMTVQQSSQNLAINWQSFGIASGQSVQFQQPSASSVVLNRVLGQDASQIMGNLSANGQVFIVNPNGVLFGAGAQVNVGGLVATTNNITDADFMAGNYRFTSEGAPGKVVNQGALTAADGGYIALLAPEVRNEGVITARLGTALLASGNQVTLNLNNGSLIGYTIDQGAVNALADNRYLIKADGGRVILSAKAADDVARAVVNNEGVIEALSIQNKNGVIELAGDPGNGMVTLGGKLDVSSVTGTGGTVRVQADRLIATGSIDASGAAGGTVQLDARRLLQSGAIDASGTAQAGGTIAIHTTERLIQTEGAKLQADGQTAGGSIQVGGAGNVFSSATLTATSSAGQGGTVQVTGDAVQLYGANLDASGQAGGGTVLVGGDYQGKNAAVRNAQTTAVNFATKIKADARGNGKGGKVVVWSDQQTDFAGHISARGGVNGGNGGMVEVSGKENLSFGGMVDAGAPKGVAGTLLLDPKNITIGGTGVQGVASFELVDPNAAASNQFGKYVTVLTNDNIVVAVPADDFNATDAGAVYLFNGKTGGLISALQGSTAFDSVGSGVDNMPGASGVTALTNGNFVVNSPFWHNGSAPYVGAATWRSGTAGSSGLVSSSNSLIGGQANDFVSYDGTTALSNGNYVVGSSNWHNGAVANAGAVTWGNGATGTTGVVSSSNSLVGSTADDRVGARADSNVSAVTALANGNYVVVSPVWDNGAFTDAGAATWGNGATGTSGAISASNSLVGSYYGDYVGNMGVTALTNGNYVVKSPGWSDSTNSQFDNGAVTWGSGTTGISGTISASNSLVGSNSDDRIGIDGVVALTNGNYVVQSPYWNSPLFTDAGAVTWGNGATGISGAVSGANSFVGDYYQANMGSGNNAVTALTNGNYVISNAWWDNGTTYDVGAVVWANGATGITGTITAGNSLRGTTVGDYVGSGVKALANGNYVVSSSSWNNGALADAGAVTWGNGATGTTGTVSTSNSFVGTEANQMSGSVTVLTNGNYVIYSSGWDNGAVTNVGAVTWANGTTGLVGSASAANSLIGSVAGEAIGSGGVTALSNGNYVVGSPVRKNGTTNNAGAITWGNGATGTTGVVSSANSLIGTNSNERLGQSGTVFAGANGSYAVLDSSRGAVVQGNATAPVTGSISQSNSLLGSAQTGLTGFSALSDGNIVVQSGTATKTYTSAGRVDVMMKGDANSLTYGTSPGASVTITPAAITAITNTGTGVTLQANNDITLAPFWNIVTSNASGDGGALTLQAGRSITLNASITTDNGNLTLIANDRAANGVVDAWRDAGAAAITMAAGTAINAGTGNVTIELRDGAGNTNNTSGDIALRTINANQITAVNSGPAAGSIVLDGVLTASGSGDAIVLSGGSFVNNAGALALSAASGRYLVYANSHLGNTLGIASPGNLFNRTYAGNAPATIDSGLGSRFVYATSPTLTVTADAASRTYGDANPALTYTVSGLVDGDTSASAFTGALATSATVTSNVGSYAITQGTLADQLGYTVSIDTSSQLMVTRRAVNLSGSKVYDGSTNLETHAVTGLVNGDVITTSGLAVFADKNAGTGKILGRGSVTLVGAQANNYTLFGGTHTGTITQKALTVAASGSNKVYDGNLAATVTLGDDRIAGDTLALSYTAANFDTKDAGTGKTVSVTGIGVTGADAANYSFSSTASTTADITPKALSLATLAASNKVYDGSASASASATLSGVVAGDTVTNAVTAAFANKNAANGKTVTVSGIALGGADAGNYSIGSGQTTTADITPKALTLTGVAASNKVYDGNATAAATASLSGVVAGDTVTKTLTAAFDTRNAGTGKTVTVSGVSLGGTDANNYSIGTGQTTTADITPKALTVSALSAADKVYDGNAIASANATLAGIVAGDTVTSTVTAAFDNKNAGIGKTVTVSGIALAGTDAGNYAIGTGQTTTADISQRALTVTATGTSKVYDGNTAATVTLGDNRVGGDALTLSNTSATFDTKNAGTAKTISVTGIDVTGTDAANYSFNTTASASADVTPKALTVATLAASNKVYDGNATAAATATLSGVVAGDTVTNAVTAAFDNKNAANGKTVTVSGIALGGADGGNYSIAGGQTTLGNITPRGLTVTATAADKVYDGNTTAAVTLGDNRIAGDVLSVTYGSADFENKQAGVNKQVNVTGLGLSGTDAGNYSVASATATTADISRKALTVTGVTASDKVYDGSTAASASGSLGGIVAGDTVSSALAATFADKNAGVGKTVTVNGVTLSGADANNYSAAAGQTTTAAITPKALTVTANDASRNFDGTAYTGGNGVSYSGLVAGDSEASLGGSLSYGGSSQGAVNPGNYVIAASGLTSPNYVITNVDGNLEIKQTGGVPGMPVIVQDQAGPAMTYVQGQVPVQALPGQDEQQGQGSQLEQKIKANRPQGIGQGQVIDNTGRQLVELINGGMNLPKGVN